MRGLFTLISTIFTVKELINENTAPVYPRSTYFDWDEYWADVANGMTTVEQNKKHKRGGYLKTK
jgi:hypothetical protein